MTASDVARVGWVKGVDASYAELTPAIVARLLDEGAEVWWQLAAYSIWKDQGWAPWSCRV